MRRILKIYQGIGFSLSVFSMLTILAGQCLNTLLLLSIGAVPFSGKENASVKGEILRMIGIDFYHINSFLIFFFSIVLIRSFLAFFEKWILRKVRNSSFAFLQISFLENADKKNVIEQPRSPAGKTKVLRSFITKVMIRIPPDILFLTILFCLLGVISIYYALLTLAFLFFSVITASFTNRSATNNQSSGTGFNYFKKIFQYQQSVFLFNRTDIELKRLRKKLVKDLSVDLGKFRRKALLNGVLTLYFFVNIFVIIILEVNRSDGMKSVGLITFILLLLYIQGTFRRLARNSMVFFQQRKLFLQTFFDKKSPENLQDNILMDKKLMELFAELKSISVDGNKHQILRYDLYQTKEYQPEFYRKLKWAAETKNLVMSFIDAGIPLFGNDILTAVLPARNKENTVKATILVQHFFSVSDEQAQKILQTKTEVWWKTANHAEKFKMAAVRALCIEPDLVLVSTNDALSLQEKETLNEYFVSTPVKKPVIFILNE